MSKEFKIESGKYYRMRSGHRVYVVATNKPGTHNVLGWTDSGNVSAWMNGGQFRAEASTQSDIISEWVEPERIPWEHLPKWCKWWAKDGNGAEWGYLDRPTFEYGIHFTESDYICPVLPENYSNYTGDWRQSLRERPEGV